MKIEKVFLRNFRNLQDCQLDTNAKHIVLTGENGQGKTNLLEAIYILCYGSSFRTQNLKDCIRHGEKAFYLSSEFADANGYPREAEIKFDNTRKSISLDRKNVKDRKELIYSIPCIVFSHEDIEFVRGEPENRRKFFNQTMTMYDPVFLDDLRRYQFVLKQRNTAIKDKRYNLIPIYDEKLSSYAIPIIKARSQVCRAFDAIFPDIYEAVAQDDRRIKITYRPSWDESLSQEEIYEKLQMQRETDIKMSTTTAGPHRDRFVITDRYGVFINSASTGQMRLASLVFRSAQAAFFRQKTGLDPVFLIDDVLLELDSLKRARYLNYLGHYNQAFFTFLPDEKYFDSFAKDDDVICYNVKEGGFSL